MNFFNEEKGIFQIPKLIKVQCSCSACDFKACLHTDQPSSCYDCTSKSYNYDLNDFNEIINQRLPCRESCIEDRLLSVKSLLRLSSSTNELSSLTMHVPYLDFEYPLPRHSTGPVANIRNEGPIDLLQKLKDIYNACCCKVCECLSGKSERNQNCQCRPCQCDDCVSFKKKTNKDGAIQLYQAEYLCTRFGKSSLKRNAKSELKTEWDCEHYECVQCAADGIISPCACKPCQCIECYPEKILQNHPIFVVANVANNNRNHKKGPSSPCCHIDRDLRLGETSNLTQHEISTEISSHQQCHCKTCFSDTCLTDTNKFCSCKRRVRVLNKPVHRDKADFNICMASITQNVSCNDDSTKKPSIHFISKNINDCKYSSASSIPFNAIPYSGFSPTTDKYSCSLNNSINCDKMMATSSHEDIYDCFKGKNKHYIVKEKINESKMLSNDTCCSKKNERIYFPFKNLSNSTLERHRKMELPEDVLIDKCGQCDSQTTTSNNVQQLYRKKNDNKLTENPHSSRVEYVQYVDSSNEIANAINLLNSNAQLSNSIFQSPMSKLNYMRNYLQSDDNSKSPKSSCNSSGHDDFNYLIRFPKKTVTVNVDYAPKCIAKTDLTYKLSDHISKKYLDISQNSNDDFHEDVREMLVSSRPITSIVTKVSKLNYDKCCLVENNSFRPKHVHDDSCSPRHREESQAENLNERWIAKNGIDNKLFNNYCNGLKNFVTDNVKECLEKTRPTQSDFYINGCERVHKTLQDARKYSVQLVKLLEQFEKENKEFVSVSKIRQKSDSTQIRQHLVSDPKTVAHKSKNKLTLDKNMDQATELEIIHYDISTKDKYTDSRNSDWAYLQDNKNDTVNAYVESKQFSKDLMSKECSNQTNKNLYDNKEITGLGASLSFSSSDSKYSNMVTEDDDSYYSEQDKLLYNQTNFLTKRKHNKTLKSHTKMYKRAITLSKRGKTFVPKVPKDSVTTEMSDASISQMIASNNVWTCEVSNRPAAKIDKIANEKEARVGDSQSSTITYRIIKKSEANTKKYLHNLPQNKPFATLQPSIETEVARRTTVQENSSISITDSMSEIQALKSWHSKYQCHKSYETDEDKRDNKHEYKSSAESCEALRVNFLTVQKVTDRKIVVMWNVPRSLKNVKGYELLVDGRMEWKIPNIYCGAVVVDSVPESNKILLTVRTVMISPSPSGHVPSTTVVYTQSSTNPVIPNHNYCHSLSSRCSSSNICLFYNELTKNDKRI